MNCHKQSFGILRLNSYQHLNNRCTHISKKLRIDVLSGRYSEREKYTFAPGYYCRREQRRKKLFYQKEIDTIHPCP